MSLAASCSPDIHRQGRRDHLHDGRAEPDHEPGGHGRHRALRRHRQAAAPELHREPHRREHRLALERGGRLRLVRDAVPDGRAGDHGLQPVLGTVRRVPPAVGCSASRRSRAWATRPSRNFNVPAFSWGHETYTRIGIVSDGYIVIGGGTGPDVDFNPTAFPNPARPNNVIAPLWTDLNPGAGVPCASTSELRRSGGPNDCWIVDRLRPGAVLRLRGAHAVVRDHGIGVNGDAHPAEDVSYVYGNTGQPGGAPAMNAGAENRDGTSGVNAAVQGPDDGWAIVTGSPTAGGSRSRSGTRSRARRSGATRSRRR